jgi:hypothetical protein
MPLRGVVLADVDVERGVKGISGGSGDDDDDDNDSRGGGGGGEGERGGRQKPKKTRIAINLAQERVTMHLQLPIRHILTFPFLALHGALGEALKLGIAKAEGRRVERKEK